MIGAMADLSERLFKIFRSNGFLSMKGQANEVPLFIQTYDPSHEDELRLMLDSLTARLRNEGLTISRADLFDLVLAELEDSHLLSGLLQEEPSFTKAEMLETLRNCSDPKGHLVPRLQGAISDGSQLTLITGSGRVFPFLRTHSILESMQPAMQRHPIVIFFPGKYEQDPLGGSHLQLFGAIPSPVINNPYYRAANMDHYRI
jgi:Domain of unknown function (DUF1788)